MPKGIWLTIGLNLVDPASYPGIQVPQLFGCENDARNMAQLFGGLPGYDPTASQSLIGNKAIRSAVQGFISNAANIVRNPGDVFVVHHSGHGMQGGVDSTGQAIPNSNDVTSWVLFDGPLAKEELIQGWFAFQPGVRILVLDDSCFSGSGLKSISTRGIQFIHRGLVPAESLKIVQQRARFFKQISDQKSARLASAGPQFPQAAVLLISGCGATETSQDVLDGSGNDFGLFTSVLLSVFNGTPGGFTGTYDDYSLAVQQQTNQQAMGFSPPTPQNPQEEGLGDIVATSDFQQSSPPFAV